MEDIIITGKRSGNGKFNSTDQGNAPVGDWQLATGHYQSFMAPVITYPRPDSETASNARHRTNYPGQDYRIPIGVSGGAWPFYFELLAFPDGMTIGSQLTLVNGELVPSSDYGTINYPNAVTGTYTVSLRVTDQNGIINTVSWQLVVGTGSYVFLDPAASSNGTGAINSPFNTVASLAGLTTKNVIVRAGTVNLEQKTTNLNNWPKSFLPYKGETVNMARATSPIGCTPGGDWWFSGFNFVIPNGQTEVREYDQFFRLEGASRTVFFENTFDYGSVTNPNTGGANSAAIMWTNASVPENSPDNGWYSLIFKNTYKNMKDRDCWLGYSMHYPVIERNSIQNCVTTFGGHGFYAKTSVDHLTFRGNFSIGITNTMKLFRMDAYTGYFPMDYYDISYNNYRFYGTDESGDGIGAISFSSEFVNVGTHHYVYRNTLYSHAAACIHARGQASASAIIASNNVMVSGGTNTNGVQLVQYDGAFSNNGYIAGNLAANILDSSNKLQSAYIAPNLGTKGAQVL